MQHRKDIDGLRAIAVLLVVAFHVHPREVTGGFVGVDVFFVISGFLITGLIRSGLRDGDFRLLDFYARRIRRIFPALAVVLSACVAVGWLVLFPDDYRNLGRHAAASAAFVANFTLWQDAGYFDAPSVLKPLLHLWSLGIEEQFYILWPAVMLLAALGRRGAPLLAACAVLIASFAVNVVVSRADPVAAFFLPATRFWELMVGCILALVLEAGRPTSAAAYSDHVRARDAASLAGSLMITLAAILIGPGLAFPGWWALLPTVGAALVIAAGPGAWVNRQVLSRPALVWLGLISYPLYLWHWPILAFLRHYSFRPPSDLIRWGAILLAVVLADLTYRFVENPIRRGRPLAWKPLGAALAIALLGCVGVAIVAEGGYARRFPAEIATLFGADNVAKVFVGSGRCLHDGSASKLDLTDDCESPVPAGTRRIVVWGDSHAANLVGGLLRLETARRDVHLIFFATLACPPVASYAYTRPEFQDCPSANRIALEKIGRIAPDTVILSGNWQQYDGGPHAGRVDATSIQETVARLRALGVARVLGVGQFPVWDFRVDKILARKYRLGSRPLGAAMAAAPIRSADLLDPGTFAWDRQAAQWFASAGAAFLSPLSTLCSGAGCLLTVPGSAAPMARDEDHLTSSGSIWFGTQNEKALLGN